MLEIYKKLPGTNCGACGESACMAFALKVKAGQRQMSDCPDMLHTEEVVPAVVPAENLDDPYERVSSQMEAEVIASDFSISAAAIGGDFRSIDGEERIGLKMVNRSYELRKQGLFEGDAYCRDSWVKMILYDYVRRAGGAPVRADWVAFDHFPNTPSHIKAFQKTAEHQLAQAFVQDPGRLRTCFEEQGTTEEKSQVKCDYSCRLDLLPRVPLFLRFWTADDEFPASCKLYVDSSANAYLDMEFLGHLVEKFVEAISAYVQGDKGG